MARLILVLHRYTSIICWRRGDHPTFWFPVETPCEHHLDLLLRLGGQQICFGWRLQFMANPKKHIKAVAICINDVACLLLGSSTKIE